MKLLSNMNSNDTTPELSITDKLFLTVINEKLKTNFMTIDEMELYCIEFLCNSSKELLEKLRLITSYLKYKKIKISKDIVTKMKQGDFAEFLAFLRCDTVDFSEILE